MADFEVPTKEHGTVRVTLENPPTDAAELRSALSDQIVRGKFTRAGTTVFSRGYGALAEPVARGVASGIGSLLQEMPFGASSMIGRRPPAMLSPEQATGVGRQAAEIIVPQRLPQALGIAATIAAGLLTGGATLPVQAGARILAAALGGGTGGVLEGQSPMEALGEAGMQGGMATVGEGAGYLGGKLLRSLPGAQRAQNLKDTAAFVDWVESVQPALAGRIPREPSALKRFVQTGELRKRLGQEYAGDLDAVDMLINRRPIDVPSLSPTPMSFEDAATTLREIGQKGWSGTADNPLTRTMTGLEARRLREQVLQEINAALNLRNPSGEAARLFDSARHRWALGHAGDVMLRQNAAYRGFPNDVRVDINNLRSMFEGKQAAKLVQDIGLTNDEWTGIMQALYRGGSFGSRDLMTPGGGRFGSHFGQMARGSAAGSINAPMAPVRFPFPALGTEYTGHLPRSLGPAGQTTLDALLQAAGGASFNPLGVR